jgi:Asp/Glu/Hydantoin racemase
LARSVPRHLRYIAAMGVGQRLAGDLPIGLGVTELADGSRTLSRMIEIGCLLRDQHGADVLIMECTGMAGYRGDLEGAVRIPVVEPTQTAVAMAIGRMHPPRLGTKLALMTSCEVSLCDRRWLRADERRGDAANHLPRKRQGCAPQDWLLAAKTDVQ